MRSTVIRTLAVAVLRSSLALLGAFLVRWQLVDQGLMEEAAGVAAFMLVDKVWELYQLHRADLYQRWVLLLGLRSHPGTTPSAIVDLAKAKVAEGAQPGVTL